MESTDEHSKQNASQTDNMATDTAGTCLDQEPFPFMRLPPELRLMVYGFAMNGITDQIMLPASGEAQEPQPYRGALALLHTSKQIRQESCYDMRLHAVRIFYWAYNACNAACANCARVIASASFDSSACEQARTDLERA